MPVKIQFSQSYYWLNSWLMANIIKLSVHSFCERFLDSRLDPAHRLYEQMMMAARSGIANIAEGSSRHSTSIESEMRLLDVARGSFDELQSDIFTFLLLRKADIWAIGHPDREAIWHVSLDQPRFSNSYLHDAAIYLHQQCAKFKPWIGSNDPDVVANALLILCIRENKMLHSQLQAQLERFREQGGFTENMTDERLGARAQQAAAAGAPNCPVCGKPMLKRLQKKGQGQGRTFWGCSGYPDCRGTRPFT